MNVAPEQGYAQQQPYNPKETVPDIPRIQQELAALNDELIELRDEFSKLASELFGAPPPTVAGTEAANRGIGAVDVIHTQIASLRDRLRDLRSACARFSRLV